MAKNELVRHMLACLVYRTTKIIHDAPENYPDVSIGNGVRTPEKVLRHINSLVQLCNRFWSYEKPVSIEIRRKQLDKNGWELEVELFYTMVAEFDETLKAYPEPRRYPVEKILQGPFLDAFTHVGQLAMLRRMAGSSIEGESYWMADVRAGNLGPDQPLRTASDKQ